jgi:cytochrome c oxidase assembly factor CtaG
MSPTLRAFLVSWDLRLEILLPLLAGAVIYARGWRILRLRGSRRLATRWRLVAFLVGLVTVFLSLLSAIDSFSADLFLMHMIQHLLLIMVAAPLIMISNPFPFILWGLPRGRDVGVALFAPGAQFARLLGQTTGPGIVWLLFVACLWGWHDPGAYDAALKSDLIHDIEHLTFYVTALLFWWHVIQSGPRVHGSLSHGARIAYTLAIVPANMVAGVAISFANEPLYEHYLTVPRLWGLTALEDQQLGGTIMWIPGSMMYLLAAIVLIAVWMRDQEEQTARK